MISTHRHMAWLDVLMTALAPAIWGSTYIVTTELLPPDRPFVAAVLRCLPACCWCCSPGTCPAVANGVACSFSPH
ncbi:hypothetical protein [Pseudomonas indica]|uniref:hypothetical protein n=1 Tax=Pseudomonas indica TaxID=137658 RepID=UPI003FD2329D